MNSSKIKAIEVIGNCPLLPITKITRKNIKTTFAFVAFQTKQ